MSNDDLHAFWHTSSHILAQAVKELYPETRLGTGPAIASGFYYDFHRETPFTPEDLKRIESKMRGIVKRDLPVERMPVSRAEAEKILTERGETFKLELLAELPDAAITFYRQGEFMDLCAGPHLDSTGRVKALALLSVAASHWKGDEKRESMQRIYGISFPEPDRLEEYRRQIEEARERDHRRLGIDLDLFSVSEAVGPGLILWHPKGGRVRHLIENFWRESHYANGYEILYTPHLGRAQLWETSGHLDFYREAMYAPMEVENDPYYLKPMNCPFHIQVYQNRRRSYRELPLRWAELGTVYRFEKGGVLHGLLRVRGFTQDDAHIICTPEQMESEIAEVLRFSLYMWRSFGFESIRAYLATRPENAVGRPEDWEAAQRSLEKAIAREKLDYELDPGGGAFYGPKIDLKIRDALGREWQTTTIQFDFNEPARFDMSYIGDDGQKHRPYMIHRALLGSLERFFGILIEHYKGLFPVWLAPIQAAVLPISAKEMDYALEVGAFLSGRGLRVTVDRSEDTISRKIRRCELEKIPVLAVVGGREREARSVAARLHGRRQQVVLALEEFARRLETAAAEKSPALDWPETINAKQEVGH